MPCLSSVQPSYFGLNSVNYIYKVKTYKYMLCQLLFPCKYQIVNELWDQILSKCVYHIIMVLRLGVK